MVFYYVIFASSDLPGTVVAVFVFSLSFGATAGSLMWSAVKAVEEGQSEAALALGFTNDETFFGVVMPQAARQFLPLLSGQLVSMCKGARSPLRGSAHQGTCLESPASKTSLVGLAGTCRLHDVLMARAASPALVMSLLVTAAQAVENL